MIKLRRSKPALILTGTYVVLALIAFVTHIYSVKTNTGDSGESALFFYLLTLPWISMITDKIAYSKFWGLMAYPAGWLMVFMNALILYGLAGGLMIGKRRR